MASLESVAKILGVEAEFLGKLEAEMEELTGRKAVIREVERMNETKTEEARKTLGIAGQTTAEVRARLREEVVAHEKELLTYIERAPGSDQFEKAAELARRIGNVGSGLFLKKSYAQEIFRKRPPEHLLQFLGYSTVEELLAHHDVTEAFSALRFMESDEWMHGTFDAAYGNFTAKDFEERRIEIKVLGPEWHEVAKKFVEKKHHNVSHLKEFGVIFINPIAEDIPGKFLRDFALLLHYLHEIEFYSKLFRRYAAGTDFATHLTSLLRGDVREEIQGKKGEWLIVQRYLFKENSNDPRLFLPRVNPEAAHWARGQRDLAKLGAERSDLGLEFWHEMDWVAGIFYNDHDDRSKKEEVVSFDLEDNAMTAVSFQEGKGEILDYHQREAMWTKIFMEYAGGESEMERLLIQNFDSGVITFNA